MGWKDRATPVEDGSSWKDRALPAPPEEDSLLDRALQGIAHSKEAWPATPESNEAVKDIALNSANSAVMGYAPQIGAAAQHPIGAMTGSPDYLSARDSIINKIQATSPASKVGGMAIGSLPYMLASGGASEAVPFAKRVIDAGRTGALIGAGMNPGDKPGEYNPVQFQDRAMNSVMGAGVGGAGEVAASGLGYGANKMLDIGAYLREHAGERAAKALGMMKREFDQLGRDRAVRVGNTALDEGIVTPLATTSKMSERTQNLIPKYESRVQDLINNADNLSMDQFLALSPDEKRRVMDSRWIPSDQASQISADMQSRVQGATGADKAMSGANDLLSEFAGQPEGVTIADLNQQKRNEYNLIPKKAFGNEPPDVTLATDARKRIASSKRQGVEDMIDARTGAGSELAETNRNYGDLLEANQALEDKMARQSANTNRLVDAISGSAGTLGGLAMPSDDYKHRGENAFAGGLLALAAGRLHRQFGPQMMANTLRAGSNLMQSGSPVMESITRAASNPSVTKMLLEKPMSLKSSQEMFLNSNGSGNISSQPK